MIPTDDRIAKAIEDIKCIVLVLTNPLNKEKENDNEQRKIFSRSRGSVYQK